MGRHGNVVKFVEGPSMTTLAFVFRKLAGDFYDKPQERIVYLGKQQSRTREHVLEAAKTMLTCSAKNQLNIPVEQLSINVFDDSGIVEDVQKKWSTKKEDTWPRK